ncbi:MAG: FUSC family protein [Rhodospirillales bacterium]|nr:FUSC family protein [Rhodospirillales bacterium]
METGKSLRWPFTMPQDILGIRFALNVAIATVIVWYSLKYMVDTNPIWAIASMVAASDPQVTEAARMFRSRLINVLVGGMVGLLFLVVGGPAEWMLPFALAVTVLLSSYVVHIQTMWRQAPITAAIVIASGVTSHSRASGVEHGLHKVAEVVFGCLVGLLVSWVMAKIWPIHRPADLKGP